MLQPLQDNLQPDEKRWNQDLWMELCQKVRGGGGAPVIIHREMVNCILPLYIVM